MTTEATQSGSRLPWRQLALTEKLEPHPDNPRTDLGDLKALEESIRKRGLDIPLTVVPRPGMDGYYWIIDGDRRYYAMREWNDNIPVVVKPLLSGETLRKRHLLTALVTGTMQKPLDPIERARAYGRLMNEGPPSERMTQAEIGEQVGLTGGTIGQYVLLLDLSPTLQKSVQQGKITVREGSAMVKRARASERRRRGQAPMLPVWDPPWFTRKHPLADKAAARCEVMDHSARRRRGKEKNWPGACEQCWQAVIEDSSRAEMLERCAAAVYAADPALAGKWREEAKTLRQ
jgi:ParB/RepB/Spo0J family partition protein